MDVPKVKYSWVVLVSITVAYLLTVGAHAILQAQPIFDQGPDILGFSAVQMNMLFTVFTLVTVIVYFVQGPITDRVGSRKMMLVALLLTAASMAIMGFAPSLSYGLALLVYCGVLGVASGITLPAMFKTITEWFHRRRDGNAFGIVTSVGGLLQWFIVGVVLAGLFTANGADAGAWTLPWLVMGALNLVFVPAWFYITSRKPPAPVAGRKEERPAMAIGGSPRALYKHPALWLWGAVGFTLLTNFFILITYMPTYVVAVAHFDPGTIPLFMMALMFVGGPLCGMGGGIADKIGGLKITMIALLLGTVALIPAFVTITDFWIMIIIMILLAPGGNLAYGAFYKVITEMGFRSEHMGTATGIVLGVQWLAAVVMSVVAGILLSGSDPRTALTCLLVLAGVLPLIGFGLCFVMRKWVRAPSQEGKGAQAPPETIPGT